MTLQQVTALIRRDNLSEAVKLAQKLLRHHPGNTDALRLLAHCLARQGKLARAAVVLRLLADDPAEADGANASLAPLLLRLGQVAPATAAFRAVLAVRPKDAAALSGYGQSLAAAGNHLGAVASFKAARLDRPDDPDLVRNLAASLRALNRMADAIELLGSAFATYPELAAGLLECADRLTADGDIEAAVACCRDVLGRYPENITARMKLANLLRLDYQADEALAEYQRLCVALPTAALPHSRRGELLKEHGRLDDARSAFAQAIALEPDTFSNYMHYFRSGAVSAADPILQDLLDRLDRSDNIEGYRRIDLHFAAASGLAAIGRHDASFEHQLIGNRLKRATLSYDDARQERHTAVLQVAFTQEFIGCRRRPHHREFRPIFIVGMPRSGSTLVEQIIASHPRVVGAGELNLLSQAVKTPRLADSGRRFPSTVQAWSDAEFDSVAIAYRTSLEKVVAKISPSVGIDCIADKMLPNFRYAGLIHMLFPSARIIHTVRDPIDTCLSCFSINFSDLPFTYDLAELGAYYRRYRTVMQHWRNVLPAGTILDINYDSVVNNLEGQARRVLAFCGLDWDAACTRFYETSRSVRSASAAQVRQPIYQSSQKRWRPNPEQLAPLIDAMGCWGQAEAGERKLHYYD